MIRLALLRHGHTAWNRAGRIQGRSDIALDPEAEQGLAQRALPAPWDHADLWSSPLMRAQRTAQLVARRTPQTSPALIEMNWGNWEGLHGVDLKADPASGYKDIQDWGWSYRPPNGESPDDMRRRLLPWATSLTRDSLAVCHIGIMRVLMAHATGWSFSGPAPFTIKRDRLYVITISEDGWLADPEPIRLIAVQP